MESLPLSNLEACPDSFFFSVSVFLLHFLLFFFAFLPNSPWEFWNDLMVIIPSPSDSFAAREAWNLRLQGDHYFFGPAFFSSSPKKKKSSLFSRFGGSVQSCEDFSPVQRCVSSLDFFPMGGQCEFPRASLFIFCSPVLFSPRKESRNRFNSSL